MLDFVRNNCAAVYTVLLHDFPKSPRQTKIEIAVSCQMLPKLRATIDRICFINVLIITGQLSTFSI